MYITQGVSIVNSMLPGVQGTLTTLCYSINKTIISFQAQAVNGKNVLSFHRGKDESNKSDDVTIIQDVYLEWRALM